jgi:hypothetical protein
MNSVFLSVFSVVSFLRFYPHTRLNIAIRQRERPHRRFVYEQENMDWSVGADAGARGGSSGGSSGGGADAAKTASAPKGGGKAAPASDFTYDASADGKGVVIKKYTGKGGKVVIPGEIEGLPVVELGHNSFEGENYDDPGADLTAVVIPASVNLIGEAAFNECEKLASVTIQGSGVVIGRAAFASSTELAELVFPDGEKTLVIGEYGNDAFWDCKKLPLAMRAKLKDIGFTGL